MKTIRYILMGAMLVGMSACQKDNTGWVVKEPEEVTELSRKPVKPTQFEIPVTRPEIISEADRQNFIGHRLRDYSWQLFRKYYHERKESQKLDNNLVLAPYNMLTSLRKHLGDLDVKTQIQLLKEIGLGEFPLEEVNEYCKTTDIFSHLDEDVAVRNDGNSPSIRAHWRALFPIAYTQKEMFHKADDTNKEVDMMYGSKSCYERSFQNYTIVKLNLGSYLQAFFVRPNYYSTIDDVIQSFRMADLNNITNCLKGINMWMPKFDVQDSLSLELSASDEQVHIEQNVVLKFSESGVVDATQKLWKENNATYSDPYAGGSNFRLDKPFIYGIVESVSGLPLYIGYYGY